MVHYITVLYENTPLWITSVGKTPITLLVQKQHLHHAITQKQKGILQFLTIPNRIQFGTSGVYLTL